jgi:hypothetical protein
MFVSLISRKLQAILIVGRSVSASVSVPDCCTMRMLTIFVYMKSMQLHIKNSITQGNMEMPKPYQGVAAQETTLASEARPRERGFREERNPLQGPAALDPIESSETVMIRLDPIESSETVMIRLDPIESSETVMIRSTCTTPLVSAGGDRACAINSILRLQREREPTAPEPVALRTLSFANTDAVVDEICATIAATGNRCRIFRLQREREALAPLVALHASNNRGYVYGNGALLSLRGAVVIRPRPGPFVQRKYSGWIYACKLGMTFFAVALLLFYSRTSDTSTSTSTRNVVSTPQLLEFVPTACPAVVRSQVPTTAPTRVFTAAQPTVSTSSTLVQVFADAMLVSSHASTALVEAVPVPTPATTKQVAVVRPISVSTKQLTTTTSAPFSGVFGSLEPIACLVILLLGALFYHCKRRPRALLHGPVAPVHITPWTLPAALEPVALGTLSFANTDAVVDEICATIAATGNRRVGFIPVSNTSCRTSPTLGKQMSCSHHTRNP